MRVTTTVTIVGLVLLPGYALAHGPGGVQVTQNPDGSKTVTVDGRWHRYDCCRVG
jgi:hypothetical protein